MRVGKEVKRQILAEDLKRRRPQPAAMSDNERKSLYDNLMTLPRDKQVPALRSAGLTAEADALEQKMAEEHLEELRRQKLESINALPEDERMYELIAAGFTDEAKALSEKLAAETTIDEDDAKVEEQTEDIPDVVEKAAEPEVKEEAPKRKGRPKKQKK